MIEQQVTLKAEKWATTHLFFPGSRPIYVTLVDWFRAARFLSLPSMCIDQSLAAIYMPRCCQIVVLRRRALFIMMMCRQRRPPARKKRGASRTSFMSPVIYVVHQPLYVLLVMMLPLAPDRCASKTNCVSLLYLLSSLLRLLGLRRVRRFITLFLRGEAQNKLCFIQFVTLTARYNALMSQKNNVLLV